MTPEIIDSVKRFVVVIVTELLLFVLGLGLLYIEYTKNFSLQDILNPINPFMMIVIGIGTIGGGYIGVKTFENIKDGGQTNGQQGIGK